MNILVTAGNTQTPIDQVRCITNIFTGRTGTQIALAAQQRGHTVTLLTSHPHVMTELQPNFTPKPGTWTVHAYRTFDDLHALLARELKEGAYNAVVHSAAVSDYALAGTYAVASAGKYDSENKGWPKAAAFMEVSGGKLKGSYSELWLRMVPTPKLADKVRDEWGFDGLFVKFKLEVGITVAELQQRAEDAREHSDADLIVANTLEGKNHEALIGDRLGNFTTVTRDTLAVKLIERLESM